MPSYNMVDPTSLLTICRMYIGSWLRIMVIIFIYANICSWLCDLGVFLGVVRCTEFGKAPYK